MRLRRPHPSSAHTAHTERLDRRVQNADGPYPGYNQTHEKELVGQLYRHSQAELESIEVYERSHESRTRVLNKLHYLRQREPLPGYDSMQTADFAAALVKADLATIKNVRAYERKFANRRDVMEAVETARCRRIAEGSTRDTPDYHATSYGPSVSGSNSRAPGPGQLAADKALVISFYAEAINGRDLGAVDRLLSDGFVLNGEVRGRPSQRHAVSKLLEAFPDLHTETELILAEGDLVSIHQRWTGTQQGTIAGVEPTGRQVEFTSTAVLRIRDGLIAEAWDEVDLAGLMAQLADDR